MRRRSRRRASMDRGYGVRRHRAHENARQGYAQYNRVVRTPVKSALHENHGYCRRDRLYCSLSLLLSYSPHVRLNMIDEAYTSCVSGRLKRLPGRLGKALGLRYL